MHAKLNSPYIVKLYGITAEQPFCMVMELLLKGSLRDVLDTTSPEDFSWDIRLRIAQNIANALVYLHSYQPPMIHGDLKSLNILLDEKMQAKVADFGLATLKIETSSRMTEKEGNKPKGSLLWMPPELFKMKAKKNTMTDMYSFAVVLWELASHLFPYRDAEGNDMMIRTWILEGEREAFDERTPNTPPEYQQLTETCWSAEPAKRLTASEALQQLNSIHVFGKNPKAPSLFPAQGPDNAPVAPAKLSQPKNASKGELNMSKAAPKKVGPVPQNFMGNQYVQPETPANTFVKNPEKVKKVPAKTTPTPAVGNRYF